MANVRNLVVGCDGTWNQPGQLGSFQPSDTNVVKFLNALASARGSQVPYYEKGVGTRAWEALPGGIYGEGLDKRIEGCYRFLQKRYADRDWKREQNKMFLVGFSRGAYMARRLSGLIAHSGVPVKAGDCERGWHVYRTKDEASAEKLKQEGRFFDVPVEMVGVWDTVKATNDEDYHDARLAPNVAAGYHAVSIDEKRRFFPVLKWEDDTRALEVWFTGVHSDVGGGYPQCGLSDLALRWMIDRAITHGLRFKKAYVEQNVAPNPEGAIHESYQDIWIPLGEERRSIAPTDLLHHSVGTRLCSVAIYRPSNLPANPRYWREDSAPNPT